jgi:hypothetical protein
MKLSDQYLSNESDSSKSCSFKSHPKKCNDDFIISWDQNFILSPVIPGDTLLHMRVFEFHMIKDLFICEVYIPLSCLFGKLSKALESIESDNVHTAEDFSIEKIEVNDIVEDCSRSSINSIEEPEPESFEVKFGLSGESDIMNDHIGIDKNVNVNSNASFPSENVIIATPEVIIDVVSSNLQKVGDYNTDDIGNVKEIDKDHGKERHNLFSWLSSAGNTRGQTSNTLETTYNDADLPPSQSDNTPITSAFKHIFHRAPSPMKENVKTSCIVTNVDTATPLETTTNVKSLPIIIGKEMISWHKCYGRGQEDQDVEKGELYVGLSLESNEAN